MSKRNTTFWPKVGEMGVGKQEISLIFSDLPRYWNWKSSPFTPHPRGYTNHMYNANSNRWQATGMSVSECK